MKISDILLLSDVDGTLLPYRADKVPQRNIDAIKRFTEKGGKFGIATGRSKEMTEELAKTLYVNAPCIILNGGGVYDFESGKYLMKLFLPEEVKGYVKQIIAEIKELSVLVVTGNDYYHVTQEMPFANLSNEQRKLHKNADLDMLTGPWLKVLFSADKGVHSKLFEYVGSHAFEGFRLVGTNETLTELLPVMSNKGYAIEQLSRQKGYDTKYIIAIGDYYNDMEMLKFARESACVIDSPDDIKEICTFVAGKCENGAVADFIEYIESKYA